MHIGQCLEKQETLSHKTNRNANSHEQQFRFENQSLGLGTTESDDTYESNKSNIPKGTIQDTFSIMEDKSRKARSEIPGVSSEKNTSSVVDASKIEEEDILRNATGIACMDLEDATASLQIDELGVLTYQHFRDPSLSWSIKITPDEIKKIHDLLDNTSGLENMFYDQTFWTKFLKDDIDVTQFAQFGDKMKQLTDSKAFLKDMPRAVREAWTKAAEATGFQGFGVDSEGGLAYWSEFAKKYYDDILNNESDTSWRKTKSGMKSFANNALQSLEQTEDQLYSKRVRQLRSQEKAFYEEFLHNLNMS